MTVGDSPGFRIQNLWLFSLIGDDDEEGVPVFSVRTLDGTQVWPMFATDEARVASIRELAVRYGRQHRCRVTLSKFAVREEVEVVYDPPGKQRPQPAPAPASGEEAEALRCPCGHVLEGLAIPGVGGGLSMAEMRAALREIDFAKLANVLVACSHCLRVLKFSETYELVPVAADELAALPAPMRDEISVLTRTLADMKTTRESQS